MTYKAFLIKYAEIAIKGKNRYLFEDALVSQMNHALKKVDGTFHIRKEQGRIYVEMEGEYDYDGAVEALQHVFGIVGICPVVLLEDEGFDALEAAVRRLYPAPRAGSALVTNARQAEAVRRALDSVRAAKEALLGGMTPDVVLTEVEQAQTALGELTGRTAREDMVARIFERFCVGK